MTLIVRRPPRAFQGFGELVAVDVLQVQCGLWQLGFDPGRFDGLWGPVTENALNRWYAWWRSRQVSAPPPEYFPPAVNRGGQVRMPEEWAEIAAAALRGPCAREPRGAHRAPPVPEPRPLAPPPVVVGPDGPAPERPQPVRASAGGGLPWGWMIVGAALLGATYFAMQEREGDWRSMAPPPRMR